MILCNELWHFFFFAKMEIVTHALPLNILCPLRCACLHYNKYELNTKKNLYHKWLKCKLWKIKNEQQVTFSFSFFSFFFKINQEKMINEWPTFTLVILYQGMLKFYPHVHLISFTSYSISFTFTSLIKLCLSSFNNEFQYI